MKVFTYWVGDAYHFWFFEFEEPNFQGKNEKPQMTVSPNFFYYQTQNVFFRVVVTKTNQNMPWKHSFRKKATKFAGSWKS